MKKVKKDIKGITLIALVVTIIVLLILAGVAISLTIGSNGIFTRAENAVDRYEIASKDEQDEMNKAVDFMDKYMNEDNDAEKSEVEKAKESGTFFEKDTTIKDDLENEIRVPEEFKIAEDSATAVEDGIVIEDRVGNQFVWIPAKTGSGATIHTTLGDKTIIYQRTDFGKQDGNYSDYSETLPTDEEASVNANGGYYIGRFEAGDKLSTDAKKMREEGDNQSNEISIKKGQAPYNYITYDNSNNLAEGMASARGYKGTTKITSSYAWDTAINFIQIKIPDYGTYSPQGNFWDISFEYTDIEGKVQTKTNQTLVPTGQTTAVSNIYDMGGNCWERTSEFCSKENVPITGRGCYYGNGSRPDASAGYRNGYDDTSRVTCSFHVSLYCSIES